MCPQGLGCANICPSLQAASALPSITAGIPEAGVSSDRGHWSDRHMLRAREPAAPHASLGSTVII